MLQLYHQNCSLEQNTTLQKRWRPLRPCLTVTLFVTSYPYGCGMMRSQNRSVPLIMTVGVTYTMVPSITISRPQMELPSTLHKLLTTSSTMPKPPMPLPRQQVVVAIEATRSSAQILSRLVHSCHFERNVFLFPIFPPHEQLIFISVFTHICATV